MFNQPKATITGAVKANGTKVPSHPSETKVRQMEVFAQEAGMV